MTASRRGRMKAVVDRYEQQLVGYAQRLTGDIEHARDVVQETLLRFWRADRNVIVGREAEWLFTVCRNLCIDSRRRQRRVEPASGSAVMEQAESPLPTPGVLAELKDDQDRLLGFVAELPPREQEVLRLRLQSGLTYGEIARVTGTTVNNVGVTLYNALRSLRRRLDEDAAPRRQKGGGP